MKYLILVTQKSSYVLELILIYHNILRWRQHVYSITYFYLNFVEKILSDSAIFLNILFEQGRWLIKRLIVLAIITELLLCSSDRGTVQVEVFDWVKCWLNLRSTEMRKHNLNAECFQSITCLCAIISFSNTKLCRFYCVTSPLLLN